MNRKNTAATDDPSIIKVGGRYNNHTAVNG